MKEHALKKGTLEISKMASFMKEEIEYDCKQ